MPQMMKDTIALYSTIDSSIQKLKWAALVFSLSFLPLPVMANTVNVERYTTEGDEVTLRVSARKDDNLPIEGLKENQFKIKTEGQTIQPKFAPKSTRDKAYFVILLDMSGSMKNRDSGTNTQTKLSGAIDAINKFIDNASEEDIDLKISLVPFGYKGNQECNQLYPVDESTITDNPFFKVTSSQLSTNLKKLKNVPVCASTDLYKPLVAAKYYLQKQVKNIPAKELKPKLVTILLSDGYDNSDKARVRELVRELKTGTTPVKVYTLGYGESLSKLRARAQCNPSIPDAEITPQTVSNNCFLQKKGDIDQFILDEDQLKKVADETGGIYQLSATSTEVAKSLTDFLKAERDYKLVYKQPGAQPGSSHTISLLATNPNIESQPTKIEMPIFSKLSPLERLGIFGFTGVVGYVGINSFRQWSRRLKQQADSNLDG
jgi:von Willebrand factor type A domain